MPTPRERMYSFFTKQPADSLPIIEWATWWDLTLDRWHGEGLPTYTNDDALLCPRGYDDKALKHSLGLDYDCQIWFPNHSPDTPSFKVGGFISNETEYEKILPYLYNRDTFRSYRAQLELIQSEYGNKGDITWFTLNGFFWYPRILLGIEDHLYSFYDYPELYHRICRDMTEYYAFVIDEVTKYFSPQFMTFAEDMSYNLGPMLSEDTFNEFLLPYYKQLIPLLKAKGIRVIADSDGDITKLLPWLINAGVEGILPLERQAGVDINVLAKQYPDFFFIGGFDKMVMKRGTDAIEKEFERLVPAIRNRNYLPAVDHQTPPDVPLEYYHEYVRLLREYCGSV